MSSLNQALRAALDARQQLISELHAQGTDCYRLFHGSQEGAGGLTLDRYGPQLLVQSFHQTLERDTLLALHATVEQTLGLPLLLVYNDRSQGNSRIDRRDPVYQASEAALADLVGHEWGLNYRVRGRHAGQDPLLFLDLRAARGWVKQHSAGKRVLNLFAYTCGVGLSAAAGGASAVCNLDFAEGNLAVGRENGALNSNDVWVDVRELVFVPAGTNGYATDRWYTAGGLLEVGGYLGVTGHGIGEWSAQGGTVQFSGGNLQTHAGSQINLSGGTLDVQTGYIQQTHQKGADGRLYNASTAPGASDIHVIGDAASCGLPKAGHVANQEAKICADAIVRAFLGAQPDPAPVANSACYSPITASTASWLTAVYQYDATDGKMKIASNGGQLTVNGAPATATESSVINSDNFEDMGTWFKTLMQDTTA